MKSFTKAFLIIAALLGLLGGCEVSSKTVSSSKSISSQTTRKPSESKQSTLSVDDIIAKIDKECRNNVGKAYQGYEVYHTDEGNHFVIVKISADGCAYACATNSKEWKELTSSATDFSSKVSKYFTNNGHSKWHVTVRVLNDLYKDDVLFAVIDGTVV